MNATHAKPHPVRSDEVRARPLPIWSGIVFPVALASVAIGAALRGGEPSRAWVIAAVVGLAAFCVQVAWRGKRMAADMHRLALEHRMLRESIENTPMPYAVYDDQDCLIAWNKAYEATHAEAFRRLAQQGKRGRLRYDELVRVTAEATLPAQDVAEHVAERLRRQREANGIAVDREYPGLGWLRVCKFATPSGAVAGFAVDINELKQRESALKDQIALSDKLARLLRQRADTDALTGTTSRRAFLEGAAEQLSRSQREGWPLCLAMLDIDAFKAVNDTRGHACGDQVLAGVAAACLSQLRSGADLCGRMGGEEFAILMPETGLAGAMMVAERLRVAISALSFEFEGETFSVTASIGVAALSPTDDGLPALMARADAALYRAKGAGRNRVLARGFEVELSPD